MSGRGDYPGWAYLVAGLMIGLFVAFIVYLQSQPKPAAPASGGESRPPEVDKDAPKPDFDFYRILPELEVAVPDLKEKTEPPPESPEPAGGAEAPAAPAPAGDERFVLQVGSFKSFAEADKLKARLALMGVEARIQKVTVDNATWHRVRLGPYASRRDLQRVRRRLKQNDIEVITLKVSG